MIVDREIVRPLIEDGAYLLRCWAILRIEGEATANDILNEVRCAV